MQKINGNQSLHEFEIVDLKQSLNSQITLCACVHKIRKTGSLVFVTLRTGRYLVQATCSKKICGKNIYALRGGEYISVTGIVKEDKRAPHGYEIAMTGFEVLSSPKEKYSVNISDKKLVCSIEDKLLDRISVLRHPDIRAVFKISEGFVSGCREFMRLNAFTEVHTPKITQLNTSDSSNAFKVRYFDKTAYLSFDPHCYTKDCVAFFDRVYEVSPVFRAEKHNSTRHLCEYTAFDFEMGFINGIEDIMHTETAMLKYALEYLDKNYSYELSLLETHIPEINEIPAYTFHEALDILKKPYDIQSDLDPTDELKLFKYSTENHKSDFIFITRFPKEKRAFYTMDASLDNTLTESFDLIFRGLKISDGGQWIHDYTSQLEKLMTLNIDPTDLSCYLDFYKYGLPPYGGTAIGVERFITKLLKLENIRETSLFPRDFHIINP